MVEEAERERANPARVVGCALALLVGIGSAGAYGYALVRRAQAGARATQCVNHLRQVGLGAITYASDKRFLPHVRGLRENDGDRTTDHASRGMASLYYYGYLDDAELLICPNQGDDRAYAGRFPDDPRLWDWSGRTNPTPELSPLIAPGLAPTLEDSIELSFAWTRRARPVGMSSITILAADKSASDHGAGLGRNVL